MLLLLLNYVVLRTLWKIDVYLINTLVKSLLVSLLIEVIMYLNYYWNCTWCMWLR